MVSLSWPRSLIARFGKKSRPYRQIKRLHVSLTLEWLEHRDLLTTATPLVLNPTQQNASPLGEPGSSGYTPSQISHAYGFDKITFDGGAVKGNGSGQTIAIVSAYNDPTIANDLLAFDQQFGLPTGPLTVLNQIGGAVLPETDPTGDWEAEDALDVEWAHAMAPGANLVLVEANSDDITDLLAAAHTAAALPGVSVVSMSWGNAEFAEETNYDSMFASPAGHTGVTFVAASGDEGAPPVYPAISPNVLAVGGTTLTLDSAGDYISETAWSGSGGGISAYEPQPSYQKGVVSQSATMRTNPDVAYDANQETGFAVYDSYQTSAGSSPWIVMGGTSAGAPQWAAIIAIANQGRALAGEAALDGPSQTLPKIYQMPSSAFHDIVSGSSMGTPSYSAGLGYDLVTGRGSPVADQVVYYLVGSSGSSPTNPPSGSPSGSSSGDPSSNPTDPSGGNLVKDGGFELPSVGPVSVSNPIGSPWTFLGGTGITGNGSPLTGGNAPAPEGVQVAFMWEDGTILQSVNLAAGLYTISFQAAQAGVVPNSVEQIEVIVGGIVVAVITPGPDYSTFTYMVKLPSSGNQTLQFQGIAGSNGSTALLDDVYLQTDSPGSAPVSPPSPPSPPSSGPPHTAPSPSPGSQLSPPSSQSAGEQTVAPTDQLTQDDLDAFIQSVITSLYDLLLDEMRVLEAEWNQLVQMYYAAAIPINSGLNGPPQ